jgi:hypothetical protein
MTYKNGDRKEGIWDKGKRLRNLDFNPEVQNNNEFAEKINFDKYGGSKKNKRKTSKRQTSKRKTNKRKSKTTKRKTNKRK